MEIYSVSLLIANGKTEKSHGRINIVGKMEDFPVALPVMPYYIRL